MAENPKDSPALDLLRGTGLDTSQGAEFIQRRIALFGRIIALISLAFLVIGVVVGLLVPPRENVKFPMYVNLMHIGGMLLIAGVWLGTRRGRLTLRQLEIIDAVAVIGSCTAWAFFISPALPASIFGGTISVIMTFLARAILVPSSAGRTLRLNIAASIPLLGTMLWWMSTVRSVGGQPAPVTAVFQVLLLGVALTLATVTSRVLYDLRRRVREANELGAYSLEERLGSGGMGEVWRARHRLLARDAAVKLIRPEPLLSTGGDPQVLLRRFEREARATAALRSPHTVQLHDFGEADDGTLYYVMEMLVGVDLEELVSRFGPVPAERAVHILKQVCRSLEEAHENGLTHRDIKPANVFVNCIGSELDFVKVLDFGLVRLTQEPRAQSSPTLTAENSIGGTPAFMAPEVALGESGYDHRVDIYGVGCVGYWLLTGKLVFEAETGLKMMYQHANSPAPPPGTRTEIPIPGDLEQVIVDCLEKDPARRPQSAAELADRLAACKLAEPWTRERAAKWWSTHLPDTARSRPVAEALLSHEGIKVPPRVLRPRWRPAGR